MTQTIESASQPTPASAMPAPTSPALPAHENPGVARCCEAYERERKASKERGGTSPNLDARDAYRKHLPPLHGRENIRDFIACVAHGLLIRAMDSDDGSRLLYAAQVAQGALNASVAAAAKFPKSVPESSVQHPAELQKA